jgi:polysaccharide biosynthesis/export protein
MNKRLTLGLLLILATLGVSAQDLPELTIETPVGPRDVLKVSVLEDPTMAGDYTVTEDGQVVLNMVGKVSVGGRTTGEIESLLKTLLESNFVRKATVSVQIVQFGSKPISVVGAVQRPGPIGGGSNMTLIQAITQAGGLSSGYGKELYILRTGRNGLTEQLAIDIEELMVKGNPDVNVPLAPADLINVPTDTPVAIYVLGEVMKPGKVEFRRSENPTLLQAVAAAGGNTDRAGRGALIKRIVNGKETAIEVNFRAILKGREQDVPLQDNDTVVLPESFW